MVTAAQELSSTDRELKKPPTGIRGLDEVTHGGLPSGRSTLICGNAGCGKTVMSVQFLVNGAILYGEPGVFVAFEETARDLTENVRSLGYDLDRMVEEKQLRLDHVRIERSEIEETGEYDLEGLFVRLGHAIDSIGAKRVVLDTLESLFAGLSNTAILRAELRRLFRWLKDRGVTSIITAERGDGTMTRHGLEEYVSDCVILLDHRVTEQLATRRLRVVKYRGSPHGTNEYPFLIDANGLEVLPVTSVGLDHKVSNERVSTGVEGIDAMLGGEGFFRGSTILVSGSAGPGKSTLAARFAAGACQRGERCLYFAFEESQSQILRNMRSAGVDLRPHVESGLLRFHCTRPTFLGLESHLATMLREMRGFEPRNVVLDPITSLTDGGAHLDVKVMVMRLVDTLKNDGITGFFTALIPAGTPTETSDLGISSLIDTWLLVRDLESGGERNRGLYVLKSRGMEHSNQVREFHITGQGIELRPVFIGAEGMFTGSSRVAAEARDRASAMKREQLNALKRRQLERRRQALDAQIEGRRAETRDRGRHGPGGPDAPRPGDPRFESRRAGKRAGARDGGMSQ